MHLLEYSFFSLCEEVDIFYCRSMEAEFLSQAFDDSNLREKMLTILEGVETCDPTSDNWHT